MPTMHFNPGHSSQVAILVDLEKQMLQTDKYVTIQDTSTLRQSAP